MAGRRKKEKRCVECGKRITGFKDYCTPCHKKIVERMRKPKRR